MTSLECMT